MILKHKEARWSVCVYVFVCSYYCVELCVDVCARGCVYICPESVFLHKLLYVSAAMQAPLWGFWE